MNKISKISESEWEVMKLLWKSNPLTSEEIIHNLSPEHSWSAQTIKTFITRLSNKGVISYNKKGRIYYYFPLLSKEEYIKYENNSFLKRVYDGALDLLLTNFLTEKELSVEELEQLENILKDIKENKYSE
ncbi:MAG: BlaI/MecI/CopY family transcriptional regulator [Paenibacillaceae bacterium]|nr:BlaI/MecI/CopY family transcriptional regulator [Paenibacillaceae bacterium]